MNEIYPKNTIEGSLSWQQNVSLPNTWEVDMYNQKLERSYRIYIYKPDTVPPPEGYPVIYALDANSVFGTFVDAMRVQMRKPEKTGVYPAIIVGIGYHTDQPFSPYRVYDFTRPISKEDLPPHPAGLEWPPHGGAESFITFIKEKVKPEIERHLPVNIDKQTLFGHSLGGLFVLQTLFSEPDTFHTYIAGSPSIHWDTQFFRSEKEAFIHKVKQSERQIKILVGVGELEKLHFSGMNKNAAEISEELNQLHQYGIHIQFREFTEESHVSVLLPLINRAIELGSI
jgi:predicted alpha/beta superfamily hydrolase